jgi:hypothetical protein
MPVGAEALQRVGLPAPPGQQLIEMPCNETCAVVMKWPDAFKGEPAVGLIGLPLVADSTRFAARNVG